MKFIYFVLCLAEHRLRGKGLGYSLAFHPARQAEVWAVGPDHRLWRNGSWVYRISPKWA